MRRHWFLVACGILISRLAGFVRLRAFAHYFGLQSDAADAFSAAFRIPNLLQNLFGEGALSASFIPVYAALLSRGDRREADRVAAAVGSLLALATATLVLVGVLATPMLMGVLAPGFTGEKRALTVTIVRILFPGTGLLVLSAWCLGVLNSHRRFLLSYAAPVMWNAAMIGTLITFGTREALPRLAVLLAWGSVAGSALQLAVQIPAVLRVAPHVALTLGEGSRHVRAVLRNFAPVVATRGAVQISAYIDTLLASLLPTGAMTGLASAQLLYTLPVSLFGVSVAAAELPAMAGAAGPGPSAMAHVRDRLNDGLRQIAFFVIPSAVAFLALGDVVAAAVLETGRFRREDATYVWAILAGSAAGLLASTLGRLYATTSYALHDTKTPVRCALVRVALTTLLGYVCALPLPRALGIPALWGAAGLTAASGIAACVEMLLLRWFLSERISAIGLAVPYVAKLWLAALAGAAAAWAIRLALPPLHPMLAAVVILLPYGLVFLGLTLALRIPEASRMWTTLTGAARPVPSGGN